MRQFLLVLWRKLAARAAGGDGEAGEHRQLAGEGFGRGDADLGTGQRRHHHVAFARDGRGRHIDHRQRVLLVLLGIAQAGQRVGGLARLRDEDGEIAGFQRRLAVTEFGGDIDLHRQFGEALEPVFRHQPGIEGGAAGRDRQPLQLLPVERQFLRQRDALVHHVDVMGERVADHFRLLVDFLGHEVLVVALVDQHGRGGRLDDRPLDDLVLRVMDDRALAGDHHPVAVFQIAHGVGERRQRNGVGAEIHLGLVPLAVADGERRASARADHQIVFAGEQEGKREGAAQLLERGGDRVGRASCRLSAPR